MAMTFDATLKDLARECPLGILAEFDEPTSSPVTPLNVDLSAVSKAADLVLGIGEPLVEIVHVEFQSSAAAWKHADLVLDNALLFSQHHVPVHTILVLLRPQAVHPNADGTVQYSPRPGRGKMDFGYQVVRLWERPAEQLLAGELGLAPLAMLGQLAEGATVEDGLTAVAQRLAERLTAEAEPARATKLLTSALLLTGLRVDRDAALNIFGGVQMLEESDTYLMILEQGEQRARRGDILVVGEERPGTANESVRSKLDNIKDHERLLRMVRKAATAATWQQILDTP
ncbi:MAG TPA: hypothetical protein VNH11_22535 [Pirellulales bacterium]|nr:hypothetical protein [Pirellulales bacterium]